MKRIKQFPHCDAKVLHAPKECEFCDAHPDWQELRELWGINFTGHDDIDKVKCPAEQNRTIDVINKWSGNTASTTKPLMVKGIDYNAFKNTRFAGEFNQLLEGSFAESEGEPKTCTLSGKPVEEVRAEQTEIEGQHKDYVVLCPDERAKGFVRPYRDKYVHVGRFLSHLGPEYRLLSSEERTEHSNASKQYVAVIDQMVGEIKAGSYVTQEELNAWIKGDRVGGCGTLTKMGRELSETYARDPNFYGATFCVGCNKHLPVSEFVWEDGEVLGS